MIEESRLVARQKAAQATLNKFSKSSFSFENGSDCGKMAAFIAKQLGVKIPLAKLGKYKTVLGARAALRKAFGTDTVTGVADKYFPRINPSEAIIGDLVEIEGDGPLGTLTVYLGNGLVIGYHEDHEGAVPARVINPLAAWRIIPI